MAADIFNSVPEAVETRAEHLAWAKERAAIYLTAGFASMAASSFVSDLGKYHGDDLGLDDFAIARTLIGLLIDAPDAGAGAVESVRAYIDGVK